MGTEYKIKSRDGSEVYLYEMSSRFTLCANDTEIEDHSVYIRNLSADDILEMVVLMLRPCMWNVEDPKSWGAKAVERITKELAEQGAQIP